MGLAEGTLLCWWTSRRLSLQGPSPRRTLTCWAQVSRGRMPGQPQAPVQVADSRVARSLADQHQLQPGEAPLRVPAQQAGAHQEAHRRVRPAAAAGLALAGTLHLTGPLGARGWEARVGERIYLKQ